MRFQPKTPKEGINYSSENPLKEVLILVAGVSLVAGFIFFCVGQAIELAIPRIPSRWESKVFQGLGEWLETDGGTEPHTELQGLADQLAAAWPERPYAFRVFVSKEKEPNAFAVPGGRIVVTRGLLEQAESENEIAFVLGHELGHFRGRDHLRGIGRRTAFALLRVAIGSATGLGGYQGFALTERLTEASFSREQETNADEFGLSLVEAVYGHVEGAFDFFEREADISTGAELSGWVSTHPLSARRIAELEDLARERGWSLSGEKKPLLDSNSLD